MLQYISASPVTNEEVRNIHSILLHSDDQVTHLVACVVQVGVVIVQTIVAISKHVVNLRLGHYPSSNSKMVVTLRASFMKDLCYDADTLLMSHRFGLENV